MGVLVGYSREKKTVIENVTNILVLDRAKRLQSLANNQQITHSLESHTPSRHKYKSTQCGDVTRLQNTYPHKHKKIHSFVHCKC